MDVKSPRNPESSSPTSQTTSNWNAKLLLKITGQFTRKKKQLVVQAEKQAHSAVAPLYTIQTHHTTNCKYGLPAKQQARLAAITFDAIC